MDSIFHLEDGDRAAFLEQMMQAFGCVYICLRYYLPPPYNCLRGFDGVYHERRNHQQSTSHGSLARRLFDAYRESSTYPDTGQIPGIAFTSNNPYMKLRLHDFQRLVSSDFQLQFYQEAGIKTVVLMGCATGEIELGMSDDPHQVDLETEMKNLIRINFPHHTDPNQPPSSSSSSLRSLSVDSPEYPPLLFNIPATTAPPPFVPIQPPLQQTLIGEALLENTLTPSIPLPAPPITATATTSSAAAYPHEQAIQILSQIRNAQFPSIESEEAAMTKAILAVLSSPSTSSSSSHRNIPTAFRRYRPNSAPRLAAAPKHSRFKRAVLFFSNLNLRRRPEFPVQGNRPTDTQLHHMISERRRRERLNESFHILRSFLPPGTKKDKASVLSKTTEYMSSLKAQVAELMQRNLILESQLNSIQKSESGADEAGSSGERVSVETAQVSSSSAAAAGARLLELRMRVRGGSSLLDLVSRASELLKGQSNVSLTSVESNTRMMGSVAVHAVMMRLGIEGDEFDESGFREAVKRVVDDDGDDDDQSN